MWSLLLLPIILPLFLVCTLEFHVYWRETTADWMSLLFGSITFVALVIFLAIYVYTLVDQVRKIMYEFRVQKKRKLIMIYLRQLNELPDRPLLLSRFT